MLDPSLIVLGVITGAHGVRGEVKIKSFTAAAEDVVAYGPLQDKQGKSYIVNIRSASKGQLIASIQGISDRNQAELLRGIELCIPRSALPDTAEDEYYVEDLIGMSVFTPDGEAYGTIRRVDNYGAGDIVEIASLTGETSLVSFTHAVFPQIDVPARRVTYIPPELLTAAHHE